MNILIIGHTTLHWGRMEYGNIGNYYIIEPLIRELHATFPNAIIRTTLQMSKRFCEDENLIVLPMELYYDFNCDENLKVAQKEIELVNEFLSVGSFSETTPYIDEVMAADIIIDFSGDIWGENANLLGKDRFEVGLYKDLVAQKLGKPTFMLAGSPGPFYNEESKKLAKEVFKNFTLITNREPLSTEILREDGFDVSRVQNLACPSFLFETTKNEEVKELLEKEVLFNESKPIVGFVICGWNFPDGPFDKWPREDNDYEVFAKAVEYVSNNLGAKVCLLSHSNGFLVPPAQFKLIHGRDYPIIKQLQNVLQKRGLAKDVYTLDEVYDPWTTKAIISNFDMLISGRVHAAVAGFSQYIPTVVIDYGHEPKAHKLQGFARLVGQERFISNPSLEDDLTDKINSCWISRIEVREELKKRIPFIKNMAKENFRLLKLHSIKNFGDS